jgi:hypothetical protein
MLRNVAGNGSSGSCRKAEAKDVRIIVRGISSVQAYNMVTVKAGSAAIS